MVALNKWWNGHVEGDSDIDEAREVRKWGRRGFVTVVAALGVLLSWSMMARLDSAVVGHGLLKVEQSRKVVQHQEGGIVKAILVKNGDMVKQGQPLVLIEDVRVSSTLDGLEQQYYSELAKNVRLQTERDMLGALIWPPSLRSKASLASIGEVLAKEQVIFRQRRATLNTQIDILTRQISDAGDEIAATERQVSADLAGAQSARQESQVNKNLLDKGFISPTRMLALDRAVADYASKQSEHEADWARARQKQSDLRLRIEGVKTSYRDTAASELKESTDRLNDMQQRVKPISDARDRQQVVAPVDGVVVDLRIHTIGASIGPRDVLMEVVPQDEKLVAELKLPVDSISEIAVGMMVDVRLSAFQQRVTPLVSGRLTYVSADALSDPQSPQQPYYLAQVTLDEASRKLAHIGELKAGMPVEAYLRTRPRSALSYFFDPVTQSLERAFNER